MYIIRFTMGQYKRSETIFYFNSTSRRTVEKQKAVVITCELRKSLVGHTNHRKKQRNKSIIQKNDKKVIKKRITSKQVMIGSRKRLIIACSAITLRYSQTNGQHTAATTTSIRRDEIRYLHKAKPSSSFVTRCQAVLYYSCPNNNEYTFNNSEMDFRKSNRDINSNRNDAKKREIEKEEILAIRTRFPTKVPVIVRKFPKEKNLPQLDKTKYLVPQEITMSQFQTIIRNRMHLLPTQAIYLLVNEKSLLSLSLTLAEVYKEYALPDGYLYITYASQDTFGSDHTVDFRNVII